MSRKDYVAIAAAFRELGLELMTSDTPTGGHALVRSAFTRGMQLAASRLADHLAQGNPRFDRARFLTACGVGD